MATRGRNTWSGQLPRSCGHTHGSSCSRGRGASLRASPRLREVGPCWARYAVGTTRGFCKSGGSQRLAREVHDGFAATLQVTDLENLDYDAGLSEVFCRQLGLPKPGYHLGVGPGSHAAQTAHVLERLEPVLLQERPDLVVVVGDVNSTVAAALCAAKLGIPAAHVEAGLMNARPTEMTHDPCVEHLNGARVRAAAACS